MRSSAGTAFGGVAGRVVIGSLAPGTLLSGFFIGLIVCLGAWFFERFDAERVGLLFTQFALAMAYARFALNGLHGDWKGTIFSSSGGAWTEVLPVAGRYLLLNALWVAPLLLLGLSASDGVEALASIASGLPGGAAFALLVIYFMGMALTPPVFLILAVSARRVPDLFSATHARAVFGGRLGDLGLIYVLYLGAMTTVLFLSLPVFVLITVKQPALGLTFGAFILIFIGGLAVTLLGKLCGFFAFGDEAEPSAQPVPRPGPARIAPLPPAPVPALALALAPNTTTPRDARKPPLLDASARVEAAWRRFEHDPAGAIAALEEVQASYVAHPWVAHALCMLCCKAGRRDEALREAPAALALCLARGHLAFAAEIFAALHPRAAALGLTRDQTLAIGTALLRAEDLTAAEVAFASILAVDPGERRAIKGLIQVAEAHMQPGGSPAAAARIYRSLVDRCADSPLAESMRNGLAEAEGRLARVSGNSTGPR